MGVAVAVAGAALVSAAAESIWDDPAFARYREAAAALEAQDHARAIALARDAISAYPDHILAHSLWGQAALAERRWEEAARALSRVVELYPRAAAARPRDGGRHRVGAVRRPEPRSPRARLGATGPHG
jgi:tetratricopeptide (TPR) repeat protein